jgi:hypothetical protein
MYNAHKITCTKKIISVDWGIRRFYLIQDNPSRIMNTTNEMQLYSLVYYSWSALHVSGEVFAHHQEHLTVFTVFGSVHPSCCRLVPAATTLLIVLF